ncbi:autotransporter domain-containing protein [Microvirga sp. M2]|uniref:autotransporter family protein n=1 Tax=Microvirga sp. M2 TaxID=3073270 RepID=UPI0039C392FD
MAGADATNTLALGGSGSGTFNAGTLGIASELQFQSFGTLEKTGSSTWTLTGTSQFNGSTNVKAGTLLLNGSLSGSSVSVQNGATLGGTGAVGALTFAPGSIYKVKVFSAGQADRITAAGTATLSGGTVQVLAENGTYKPSTTYRILTAAGGVSGQFEGVTSNLAYLRPSLRYGVNDVTLTLEQKAAFNSVAATGNQSNVANALEALGPNNPLYKAVIGQSASGARQAFEALSGEAHASAGAAASVGASLVQTTLVNRLNTAPASSSSLRMAQGTYTAAYAADLPGKAPRTAPVPVRSFDPRRFALWGEGFGSWGKVDGSANAAGLDTSTGGFILGAEANLDQTYRLGVAAGFTRTTFDVDSRLSSGSNETVFGALYGSTSWGGLNLRLGTSLAAHDIDTQRTVLFPGFAEAVSASYDGWTAQAFGEIGYRFDLARVQVEPFVGASIMRLHTASFQEVGGVSALAGFAQNQDLGTTTLGVRAEAQISEDIPLRAKGLIGWRHAYGDVNPAALMAFAGGSSAFTVAGTPVDRDALVAEAGLEWQASQAVSLGVAYQGQIGSQAQEHALKGNFIWTF